jgi:predicted alpha/beta hydrolase family esterase
MKKWQVLFIQGAGEGAYAADQNLADNLQAQLGDAYTLHYPPMPDEDSPSYGAWKDAMQRSTNELAGERIFVGHSFGASLLLKALAEGALVAPAALFLLATPYWKEQDWDVSEYELPENFTDNLPVDLPIFFYHNHDDEIVPFAHMTRYAKELPRATVRAFPSGGHQFNNDLSAVACDIVALQPAV